MLLFKKVSKWISDKAGNQSLFNVKIHTKNLILVANKGEKSINSTGTQNDSHIREVNSVRGSLLTEMRCAIMNGKTIDDIEFVVEEGKRAFTEESNQALSSGAQLAIEYAFKYIHDEKKETGVPIIRESI